MLGSRKKGKTQKNLQNLLFLTRFLEASPSDFHLYLMDRNCVTNEGQPPKNALTVAGHLAA